MSRLMMRPPGPEPCTCDRSSPRSDAMRRASGDDRSWPPLPPLADWPLCDCACGCGGAGLLGVFSCGGVEASPCDCDAVFGTGDAPALSWVFATTCSAGLAAPSELPAPDPPALATSASMFSSAVAI